MYLCSNVTLSNKIKKSFLDIKNNMDVSKREKGQIPSLIVNIFQGSKQVQSKCKVTTLTDFFLLTNSKKKK